MEIIHIDLDNIKYIGNLSVCLGYFDAFHKGHVELIKEAKLNNSKVGLITMEPNPKAFFTNKDIKYINSFKDKCKILEELEVDYFIILKTEKRLLDLSPEDFVNKVLIPLGVYEVVCGFDYTFGKDRLGNVETLKSLSNSRCFKVKVVDEVRNNKNIKISSTLIRNLIEIGKVEEANKYLFKPYFIEGYVGHGNHLGTSFGFATANIDINKGYIIPKRGVYGGRCFINGKGYIAMINVGTHPTVKESEDILIEAHILDFDNNIYGYDVQLEFDYFIRDEKKFTSINELIDQLNKDEKNIRELFEKC